MRKIILLLAVAVLMLGFSGQAMAAFTNGDLIQVIYQTGVATGNEYVTDLGSVSGLTTPLATGPITFNNNNLFGLGTLNNYQVAYFIAPTGANSVWISSDATSSSSNSGKKTPLATDTNYMITLYKGAGATTANGYSVNTVSQPNAHSYESLMNLGSTAAANIGTFTGFQTNPNGEATITGSPVDQYLFYYSAPGNAANGLMVAEIVTSATGQTELLNPPTATPVPPSVLLFGTGLLGLVGIRRKQSV